MKLRKGDVVLLRAEIMGFGVNGEAYAKCSGDEWVYVTDANVERVLVQRLEPGDIVQGGKVIMVYPNDNPTCVIIDPCDGRFPYAAFLNSDSTRRLDDGELLQKEPDA